MTYEGYLIQYFIVAFAFIITAMAFSWVVVDGMLVPVNKSADYSWISTTLFAGGIMGLVVGFNEQLFNLRDFDNFKFILIGCIFLTAIFWWLARFLASLHYIK